MKYSDQVVATLISLHSQTRQAIRRAPADLDGGKKRDTKALSPPLQGFSRLRVGKLRIIYRREPESHAIIAEYLEFRATIYESFPSSL